MSHILSTGSPLLILILSSLDAYMCSSLHESQKSSKSTQPDQRIVNIQEREVNMLPEEFTQHKVPIPTKW